MRVLNASKLLSIGAAIALMGAASVAQAGPYVFIKDANLRASTTGVYTHNNSASAGFFTAGIFDSNLLENGTSIAQASLCAETAEHLNNAPPPDIFVKKVVDITLADVGFHTAAEAAVVLANKEKISYLVSTYLPGLRNSPTSVANSQQNAGLQAAIWDLWGLGHGAAPAGVAAWEAFFLADAALNSVTFTKHTAIWVFDNDLGDINATGDDNWQNQLMNVPEPAFYQMAALLGLGGFGILRLRRRSK